MTGKNYNLVIFSLIAINVIIIGLIVEKLVFNKSVGSLLNTDNNTALSDIKHIESKLNNQDSSKDKLEEFTNYYQCPKYKLLNNVESILNKNNIQRTDDKSRADLILPCGYNDVEDELTKISITSNNQKIYAIKGCDNLASKNGLWDILLKKYGFTDACKYMPPTYSTNKPDQISLFKENYRVGHLYFLKKNIQRKEGILLTRNYNQILEEATIGEYKVIQEAVDDLYLIRKRKVNLRVYLLIMCKNGIVEAFLYNEGKCIYSNKDYNGDVADNHTITREEHLTSLNLDVKIYKHSPESLGDLKKHLGDYKYNLLWSRIKDIFKALLSAVVDSGLICNQKSLDDVTTFQLFGGDVIFTNKMKPYLLELNKGPAMKYMTENDEKMKLQLTEDVFMKVGFLPSNEDVNTRWISI